MTWRAVGLGLFVAGLVAGFTPFNDYVLNNTPVIGSALPTGIVLLLLVFVVGVNGPLRRWRPAWALGGGELAVVLAMSLAACAVPAGGFMRYVVGNAVGIPYVAGESEDYRQLLAEADPNLWLFPDSTLPLTGRASDPVYRDWVQRIPGDESGGWAAFVSAVPWGAWVRPLAVWGSLLVLMSTALLALAVLLRRQWAENERLPFPLASIYLSLLAPPPPGRLLNETLGSRRFWIAAGVVFVLHAFAGLHLYYPRYVPELVLGYDLRGVLASGPWRFVGDQVKQAKVFFILVGVTFFLSQKVAFSLWFFFLLLQGVRVGYGQYELDFGAAPQQDQMFGALFPYVAVMMWVARQHLWQVARLMVGRRGPNDPQGRYLPYGVAGWMFTGSVVALVGWVWGVMGTGLVSAGVIVGVAMAYFLVVARVVAETGLPYAGLYLPVTAPFSYAATGFGAKVPARDFLMGQWFTNVFAHDHRESLPGYATHALKVADEAGDGGERPRQRKFAIVGAMGAAILVAFVVSAASWLLIEYRYANPLDRAGGGAMVNVWGTYQQVRWVTYEPALTYLRSSPDDPVAHSRAGHLATGAAVMTLLSVLRLRYEAFPLHPLGYLLCFTLAIQFVWFSIFLGWLAKAVTLKLGGSSLYQSAKPVFLGLIVGEVLAAAFWLVFTLVRFALGLEFVQVKLLWG